MPVLSLRSTNPMRGQIDLTHHGVCTITHSSTFIIHKLVGYISALLGVVYPTLTSSHITFFPTSDGPSAIL